MARMRVSVLVVSAILLLPAVGAQGQQRDSIEIKSIAELEVVARNSQGKKEAQRMDIAKTKVVPGDVVVYTTTYKNTGKKRAENVKITNPVPEHMDYVDKSAEGQGTKILFSVDKGKSFGTAEKLEVSDSQGKKRKALAQDYTAIQWILVKPVEPGAAGSVSFKARLQ